MRTSAILFLVGMLSIGSMGCAGNTRILAGGVNGVGTVASVGPLIIGAFAGKAYLGVIDADLAEGEGVIVTDEHGFNGLAGVGTVGNVDADGNAEGQMDREFKVDIYQAEQARGIDE